MENKNIIENMTKLYKKLSDIQKEGLVFIKSAENPYFKSKYLPLDELQRTLAPALEKHNLLVYHYSEDNTVITVVADVETGEMLESSFPIQAGLDPQKVGSTISYAKRYNLGQLFNIITDEDDDGNATTEGKSKKKETIDDLKAEKGW